MRANFMRDKLWVMTERPALRLFGTTSLSLKVKKFSGNRDSEGESFCIEYIVAAFKAAI